MKNKLKSTETYEVRFWFLKPDGYWCQRNEIFKAENKNDHNKVERMWKDKYKNDKVRLIGIYYQ